MYQKNVGANRYGWLPTYLEVMNQAINSRLVEWQKEYIRVDSWCETANQIYSLYCGLSKN